MSYQKFIVDNLKCSRRFHIAFDDADATSAHVEVKCPFCDKTVFQADNHPPARLLRQENRIQSTDLADEIMEECAFRDEFSEQTRSDVKAGSAFLYR